MKNQKTRRLTKPTGKALTLGFACCLLISSAHAGITFQFRFGDPVGTGFLDPTYGPARQAALNTAANSFSSMFGSHFANSGTIVMEAHATDDLFSGSMAVAGSRLIPSSKPGFNLGEVIRTRLQNGNDLNGNYADGAVGVNFGKPWNLDLSIPAKPYQYDFYTAVYHEFTHALGFASTIKESGASSFERPSWGAFDSFVTDRNGNKIIDPITFNLNQSNWDISKVGNFAGGGSEGLFFDGPYAVAANHGFLVPLYAPPIWDNAGSVSHLDERMLSGDMMMSPFTGTGPRTHDYSPVEVGIMTDLGYVPAVPEPETSSLLLAGLMLCGWVARRRETESLH
jgi:hypothetical protein